MSSPYSKEGGSRKRMMGKNETNGMPVWLSLVRQAGMRAGWIVGVLMFLLISPYAFGAGFMVGAANATAELASEIESSFAAFGEEDGAEAEFRISGAWVTILGLAIGGAISTVLGIAAHGVIKWLFRDYVAFKSGSSGQA